MPDLNPLPDAWLIDPANPPAASAAPTPASTEPQQSEAVQETRLLSTSSGLAKGEARRIDTLPMDIAEQSLESVRGEVSADGSGAMLGTMYPAGPKFLKVTATLEYVHGCWKKKFRHLDNDMEIQVTNLGKAADRRLKNDQEIAAEFQKGG